MGLINKIFGTRSQREVKALTPIVDKIEALSDEYKALSDQQLRAKTDEFKARLAKGETLDDILPEAFATCREAADRVLGMRPYRVQLIGGIILHQGRIAEMKTGEGKTLVATLPAYLNALAGKGVHIVTVNDYLAKRDSEWMGKVYRFLGLTVGLVIHGVDKDGKKAAYAADITYGTNNEFGFDYLRDNMAIYASELVQRGHSFAIVDEVDSILIDEARTPLIISGQGEESTQLYTIVDSFVARLTGKKVASVDEKQEEDRALDLYGKKEQALGAPLMRELERVMMLRVVDEYWMDNIDAMQELRQGIGLRAYGQNDPVVAYKKEGYEMFESMIAAIQAETIRRIFLARVQVGATTVKRERVAKVTGESAGSDGTVKKQPVKKGQKVGRNDPCPCGSGKKYKKCCGMHEDE